MNVAHQRPAVFLDRDGVLNRAFLRNGTPVPPQTVEDFEVLPGAAEACRRLRAAGFLLVVVTNQPDIGRGTQDSEVVEQMHAVLRSHVELDEICVCPHDDSDACTCRKPLPGMIIDAAERLSIDLARSYCVGDRWRDIEAGQRAGVHTVHIDYDYAERRPIGALAEVADLAAAASWILTDCQRGVSNDR